MTLHSCHKSFELVIGNAHGMVESVGSPYTDMGPSPGSPLMSCAFLEPIFSLVNGTGLTPVPSLLL